MPSFRIWNFDKETNKAELRLNLNLFAKKRDRAEVRQATYKCQVDKYFNKRVKHRSFQPSDLILREVTVATKELNAEKLGWTCKGHIKLSKFPGHGLIGWKTWVEKCSLTLGTLSTWRSTTNCFLGRHFLGCHADKVAYSSIYYHRQSPWNCDCYFNEIANFSKL